LGVRNRHYREAEEAEKIDSDSDGIPDAYQQDGAG
jgi:Na+:H+ antiporter, NhaA family